MANHQLLLLLSKFKKITNHQLLPLLSNLKIDKSSAALLSISKKFSNHQLLPLLCEFKNWPIINCSLCCLNYKIVKSSAAPSAV
jgi:hypothetical protein